MFFFFIVVSKTLQNLSGTLETANPVTNVELNQNQIINENKAHLYLVFSFCLGFLKERFSKNQISI